MAAMYNGRGGYSNGSVLLIFGFFMFLTVLPPAELCRQHGVMNAGGEKLSGNVTHGIAAIKNESLGNFGFRDEPCSKRDISVKESYIYSLSNGIPAFYVKIINTCSRCTIRDIHINCAAFTSTVEINPKFFRQLAYGDCLVNDGQKLEAAGSVSFIYVNSFMYPFPVSSVKCDP